MSARAAFKEIDVTRAIRGARKAGCDAVKITIAPNGEMIIFAGTSSVEATNENSFDRKMRK